MKKELSEVHIISLDSGFTVTVDYREGDNDYTREQQHACSTFEEVIQILIEMLPREEDVAPENGDATLPEDSKSNPDEIDIESLGATAISS